MLLSSGPTMAGGVSWGDDRREKGYIAIPVNTFTGVDGALFSLVDIALIVGNGKVVGHKSDEVESSSWRVLIRLYPLIGFESQLVTPVRGDPRS